ncbi:MAG: prolipoprotein diacylglyceryl transferase [Clostridia bacterium]|nr:prolipoprotein diacylglyceryl transferase [Clostridia bacterium]
MLPYFTVFGIQISSYSLMAGIGFFSLWFVAWIVTRKQKEIDQNHVPHIALAAMAGLFIGAHILYGVVNFGIFIRAFNDNFSLLHTFRDYVLLFVQIFGGMVFYGGLFGAVIGAVWYIKALKLPFFPYMDVMGFCIPLFHGFARIGCFLAGCCYGVECRFGFVFHRALEPSANGVSRFPVQLLESGLEFMLFAVILVLYKKRKCSRRLMYVYLLSYAVIRFFDEFLRGDRIRGFVGPLSTSQFISVLVFVSVIMILIVKSARGRNLTVQPAAPKETVVDEGSETKAD